MLNRIITIILSYTSNIMQKELKLGAATVDFIGITYIRAYILLCDIFLKRIVFITVDVVQQQIDN